MNDPPFSADEVQPPQIAPPQPPNAPPPQPAPPSQQSPQPVAPQLPQAPTVQPPEAVSLPPVAPAVVASLAPAMIVLSSGFKAGDTRTHADGHSEVYVIIGDDTGIWLPQSALDANVQMSMRLRFAEQLFWRPRAV